MHSPQGPPSEHGAHHSPSPEKRTSDSYSLHEFDTPEYRDEEDPERARRPRQSGGYGDLELGSVPLLPADIPDQFHISDDSDFDDDEFHPRESFRHDPPFSCTLAGLAAWCRGPVPPHVYRVNPWFPKWQAAPGRLVERWAPRRWMKIALLLAGLVFWAGVFFSSLKASVAEQMVPGYGRPVKLSCDSRLWYVRIHCMGIVVPALTSDE